jgi:hypothetical protein
MLVNPESGMDGSDETISSDELVAGGNPGVSESATTTGEVLVASPTPPVAEPPQALLRLKAYCEEHGLKSTIDLIEPIFLSVEFRNGRSTRAVYIGSEDAAEKLLQHPLAEIVFLGDYSAICSYKGGWIEAAVRAHGAGPSLPIDRRRVFGVGAAPSKEPAEIEITGTGGLTLRLSEKPGLLYLLDYGSPIYLRIEGIGITDHDKAVNLLEDLSNALFMQIDFKFGSPLTLGRERILSRSISKSSGRLDEDSQLQYPRFSYERTPSSLYWYARSATSMPLLQFLAFYQCIEFFFPQYSRQETIAKIKNVLKDPAFDATKDSYINVILNATMEGRRGTLLEERKQLTATLKHCVEGGTLRDFLNESEERKRYYGNDYKKISGKKIMLSEDAGVIDQTAARMYDIRCKVVHTKNLEGGEGDEMILPFSEEADLLGIDVELIKFLAQRILIASSVPLKI